MMQSNNTADTKRFFAMLDRHAAQIKATMRPDAKVTIIVRAPEALPEEAMISSNDHLPSLLAAIAHFAGIPVNVEGQMRAEAPLDEIAHWIEMYGRLSVRAGEYESEIERLRKALLRAEGALSDFVDGKSPGYIARNGRQMTIQADDGERCDIIHSDVSAQLEGVLSDIRLLSTASQPPVGRIDRERLDWILKTGLFHESFDRAAIDAAMDREGRGDAR